MQIRLIITVGTLLFGASLTKAGMTWEEWTPENGIVDGQVALQEMLQASQIPDENWQEKAQAFINAFEKLKLQLQFFWRSQVGDGATDGDPWNGIPGGIYSWEEKGYIKRDCPIILHFWANGHVGKYVQQVNSSTTNIYSLSTQNLLPSSSTYSEKDFKKLKGKFKKYIFTLFKMKNLKSCAVFLNQNFCRPVSNLVIKTVETIKKQEAISKQELEILFGVYGVYDCIDFELPRCMQENYNNTTETICTFVADCCYDMSRLDFECKKWIIDLFKNYKASPYKTEDVGLGHFNLNLTDILQKIVSKQKMDPKEVDERFKRVMNIVIEEWQQEVDESNEISKRNANLMAWFQATATLHNAIYN